MKKILILLALTFFSCAEKKNNLTSTVTVNDEKSQQEILTEQTRETVLKAFNAQENNLLETKIVKQWMDYSKAFEYKDYNRIANHFTYPAVFNLATPIVVNDKKMMVDIYKSARENTQKGYRYSLLEKWVFLNISEDLIILDASYSRFNAKYESIHTGRGLYTYKNIKGDWLMTEVTTLK